MLDPLARSWGWLALRGVVAIIFGLLALLYPTLTLAILILLFGAFVIADGLITVAWALMTRRRRSHWAIPVISGVLSIAIGVAAFVLTEITALVLLYLIAAWAVVTGTAQIVVAFRLRKVIEGEWMLIVAGLVAVIFGVLLFVFPGAGALAMVIWIGIFMLLIGALLIGFSLRLRRWQRDQRERGIV